MATQSDQQRGNPGLTLVIVVALAGAVGFGVFWLRSQADSDAVSASESQPVTVNEPSTPAPAKPPAPEPSAAPEPAAEPAPEPEVETTEHEPPPGDPPATATLFEDPLPEDLQPAWERLQMGRRLSPRMVRAAYDYGKAHPDDPRPQLIMAFDEMHRNWWEFALHHYEKAVEADESAKHEPQMLDDLLHLAGERISHEKTTATIKKIYGSSVQDQVQERLEHARAAGEDKRARWLERLATALQE